MLLKQILDFCDILNEIPSETDKEDRLLGYIAELLLNKGLPITWIETDHRFCSQRQLWVGNPKADVVFVTHCDRAYTTYPEDGQGPINEEGDILIGKFDNTISLAVALLQIIDKYPQNYKNFAVLITTSEESGRKTRHGHGGRGFCEFLYQLISSELPHFGALDSYLFICLDVRPIKGGDRYYPGNRSLRLGNGLVLRTLEARLDLVANEDFVNTVLDISENVPLNIFRGGGITEIGRGYEKVILRNNISKERYKIAWIQLPIDNYHTTQEKIKKEDVVSYIRLLELVIKNFD